MKVLQINSVYEVGSTGRIVADLGSALTEQGDQYLACFGRRIQIKNEYANTYKIGDSLDIKIHGFLTRIFDMHGFGSLLATKRLIKVIIKFEPDIIHLHNIHGYYINIRVLFKFLERYKKPVVWTLHDCWSFTGHCAHFDYINCEKWTTSCHNCPQKREYPSSKWLDNSSLNYKRKKELFTSVSNMNIVAPSLWLRGLIQKSYLSKYPVHLINNGIDLSVFKPIQDIQEKEEILQKIGCKGKFIILGVASVWGERKGLNEFLSLAKMLTSEYQIILVGLSEKQKKTLPSNMIGVTRTNNIQELAEYYAVADVFVNPTLEDTFPTTNIEALACGTPIITYNTGGSPEIIDEKCGIIIEKKEYP